MLDSFFMFAHSGHALQWLFSIVVGFSIDCPESPEFSVDRLFHLQLQFDMGRYLPEKGSLRIQTCTLFTIQILVGLTILISPNTEVAWSLASQTDWLPSAAFHLPCSVAVDPKMEGISFVRLHLLAPCFWRSILRKRRVEHQLGWETPTLLACQNTVVYYNAWSRNAKLRDCHFMTSCNK